MSAGRPILLLGGSGQLGRALQETLIPVGTVFAPARATLDLARPEAIVHTVRELAPRLIVNAAAWTDVDGAEDAPDAARAINAVAPGLLAAEAARCGAAMVQYSTDYVFDGTATRPYREDDTTRPLGVYGASKRDGEEAVRAALAEHLILRTAWLYASQGRNFVTTIARLAQTEAELRVVEDQVGSPTWATDLARDTAAILTRCLSHGGDRLGGLAGTYHLAGGGATSRYDFACVIIGELARRAPGTALARVLPISTGERRDRARRPAYAALDRSRACRTFGLDPAPWERRLAAYFDTAGTGTES